MSFWRDKSTAFSGNKALKCGNNVLSMDKPLVMGILNLTPDSFFDGGRFVGKDAWIAQTEKMISDGAAIIDLGAVSTRPGAEPVTETDEIKRLLPVVELLTARYADTVFSVDTYRANVAKLSVEAGAGLINDISAGDIDAEMIEIVASNGLPYIVMHMQGKPSTMQINPHYTDVTAEVSLFFEQKLPTLYHAGIQQLILDPGFGFGKSIEHNYILLNNLDIFKKFGIPVMVGLSRKSMVYKVLDITPEDALPATTALHFAALLQGADILRVHDVKEAVQAVKLAEVYMTAR